MAILSVANENIILRIKIYREPQLQRERTFREIDRATDNDLINIHMSLGQIRRSDGQARPI